MKSIAQKKGDQKYEFWGVQKRRGFPEDTFELRVRGNAVVEKVGEGRNTF